MWKLAMQEAAAKISGHMLKAGYIVLPGGVNNDIVGITPPRSYGRAVGRCLQALRATLSKEAVSLESAGYAQTRVLRFIAEEAPPHSMSSH